MNTSTIIFLVISSYIIGSIPFGVILSKLVKRVDIRSHGSGNIGATNVGRVLGKKWGIVVFILDFAKGFIVPFLIQSFLFSDSSVYEKESNLAASAWTALVCCSLSVILGHIFSVFLLFRGGKGVAASAGVFTVLTPIPFLIALSCWIIIVLISRYVSLGSICAALILPISFILLNYTTAFNKHKFLTIFTIVAGAILILRHISNIKRLLSNTEHKIGKHIHVVTNSKAQEKE
ncbi:MAG: glycerol-3-phosphate 1-O-acyltransferase PlsY [Planctomycetota bacterium]